MYVYVYVSRMKLQDAKLRSLFTKVDSFFFLSCKLNIKI